MSWLDFFFNSLISCFILLFLFSSVMFFLYISCLCLLPNFFSLFTPVNYLLIILHMWCWNNCSHLNIFSSRNKNSWDPTWRRLHPYFHLKPFFFCHFKMTSSPNCTHKTWKILCNPDNIIITHLKCLHKTKHQDNCYCDALVEQRALWGLSSVCYCYCSTREHRPGYNCLLWGWSRLICTLNAD